MVNIIERIDFYSRPPTGLLLSEVLRGAALDGGVVGRTETQLCLLTVRQLSVIRALGQHGGPGRTFAESVLILLADSLATDIDPDPFPNEWVSHHKHCPCHVKKHLHR